MITLREELSYLRDLLIPDEELGPKLLLENNDPYRYYLGGSVDIHSPQTSAWGVYRGKNDAGDLVVQPSVVSESIEMEGDKEPRRKASIRWSKGPIYMAHQQVVGVFPISKDYIEMRIAGSEKKDMQYKLFES